MRLMVYNVAPTQKVPVILNNDGILRLDAFRWGLIPFWAKDAKIGYKMINARADTVAEKPVFRDSFKRRRCLIPADGFI
jgi:putative SOS response-associated peptidase YedK